ERWKLTGVAARVIGRDPSNWAHTVTIDRGSHDGLRIGLPVVDGNAVVGQIVAVSRSSSQVLLLSDNSSAIDAIVQKSRAQGTVEGALGKKLYLRNVLREQEVLPGDRVIASGLDGVFPKGTLIGVVTRVDPAPNGVFQNVELEPSTDLVRLESVLVLIGSEEPGKAALPIRVVPDESAKAK
ncbi:MAG: rod shape-determining protein MreC, partial [Deltaproteobacteria bacterium]|nr:rod shape-determining protein MreC [Deltaproteobacteria bacterium]